MKFLKLTAQIKQACTTVANNVEYLHTSTPTPSHHSDKAGASYQATEPETESAVTVQPTGYVSFPYHEAETSLSPHSITPTPFDHSDEEGYIERRQL